MEAMRADKKTQAGELRFVLARRIGAAQSVDGVAMDAVESVLAICAFCIGWSGEVP